VLLRERVMIRLVVRTRALRFLWSWHESLFAELACLSVDEPEHAVLVLHRCGVLVLACVLVKREKERK
jgi:hypothetical protein